jgi:thiamine pyrophosphate-dependent acetolactate synthase large subunit-like protein
VDKTRDLKGALRAAFTQDGTALVDVRTAAAISWKSRTTRLFILLLAVVALS